MKPRHTRSGARRSGDDYQDIIALDIMVEMLEHPDRYQWIQVEADDAGTLDDVLALCSDGSLIAKQVKFSVEPEKEDDPWKWDDLLRKGKGKDGKELPSLLQKWAVSLEMLKKQNPVKEACVISNRKPDQELKGALKPDFKVYLDRIIDPRIKAEIIRQLSGEETANIFFSEFCFKLDQAGLDVFETSVKSRFFSLGGENIGWLNLKDTLRLWVRERNQPPPEGKIILEDVRKASRWIILESMPQEFEVPEDYVLPSEDFHQNFFNHIKSLKKGCIILIGSPGIGKSTYLSYIFGLLNEENIAVIRHHYFLSLSDRTVGRLEHERVAESLMRDIQEKYPDSLGEVAKENPSPSKLTKWIEVCGRYFTKQNKILVIILDGLDHVWREKYSIEQLNKLFEHLLPVPDGIVILFGTQPLDEGQLPRSLLRTAPKETWFELPYLEKTSVRQWLEYHKEILDLPNNQQNQDLILERLTNAFYSKSQGHPLHLKYTIKALVEQELPISERSINQLPGCPHKNIAEYYQVLWNGLSEESKEMLHLFAACGFPWPQHGIIDCLDSEGKNIFLIVNALKKIKHLMVDTPLGMSLFHSSLLAFIESNEDHSLYLQKMKECTLKWLTQKAPEFWKWAYYWLLEADIGDIQPLIDGPNREWALEAITKRYPRREALDILERSSWIALKQKNIQRFIRTGLLKSYFENAYEERREVIEKLLFTQLIINNDTYFRLILQANSNSLTTEELFFLAEDAARENNQKLIFKCIDILYKRLVQAKLSPKGSYYENWRSYFGPFVKTTALSEKTNLDKVFRFATQNTDFWDSFEAIEIFSEALRNAGNTKLLRQLFKMNLSDADRPAVLKHAVLLALEKNLDLYEKTSFPLNHENDTFAAIYSALHGIQGFKIGKLSFPPESILQLKEYEHVRHRRDIESFFYNAFFVFLGNHLCNQSELNQEWLQDIGIFSWPHNFLHILNGIADKLTKILKSNSSYKFSWIYDQLKDLPIPSWPEDRDVFEYGGCARRAINQIGLDILSITISEKKYTLIEKDDLEIVFSSSYCYLWEWMEVYINRRRPWINETTVKWLLQKYSSELAALIEEFPDRASKYGTLAAVAALHGFIEEARLYVHEAASNILSYGHHKDTILDRALDIVRVCHKANIPEAKEWLFKLAPAVSKVGEFTDGDETGHLPSELSEIIAEVVPEKLPAYYQWLCSLEEYDDALSVFHTFLKTADLTSFINQAIAKTAIDDESIDILTERFNKGDQGAKIALSEIQKLLGKRTLKPIDQTKQSPKDYSYHNGPLPLPEEFPPCRLKDYLTKAEASFYKGREECVEYWLEYWKSVGRLEEAYSCIEKEEDKGVELGNYNELFNIALSLYGEDKAYPWLIKAYQNDYGWNNYWSKKEDIIKRWEIIANKYSQRWYQFIIDTLNSRDREPWRNYSVYGMEVRMVEYLLFMGQVELAKIVADQCIDSILELVSPLKLPSTDWISNSE